MTTEQQVHEVLWDGKLVSFRVITDGFEFTRARRRYDHFDVCPLCRSEHDPNLLEPVVLFVGTQLEIPNRILHKSCFEKDTPEYIMRLITDDWAEAQKYRGWFE